MKILASLSAVALLSMPVLTALNDGPQSAVPAPVVQELPRVSKPAFKRGEMLEWRVHYGIIDAGVARLEVEDKGYKVDGRDVLHMVGTGETNWTFDLFFRVRDYYGSYIDAETVEPILFTRRVDEGGYKIKQDYIFNRDENTVEDQKGKVHDVPSDIQDMISAFYYARTLDLSKAKVGQIITVNSFVDGEVFPLQIKYLGKDEIKVTAGKFRCMKFAPVVQKGRIFKKEEDLTVWITDDENRVPVLGQAKILVGSIKLELQDYNGLANPIAKLN